MTVHIQPIGGWCCDASYVAERMREADRREVEALSRCAPDDAVRRSIEVSQDVYIAYDDDEPIAVLGAQTVAVGLVGVPWLLGTDRVADTSKSLISLSRRYVNFLQDRHSQLMNVVHDENRPSKLFLQAIGFTLTEPYRTSTGALARTFSAEGRLHV